MMSAAIGQWRLSRNIPHGNLLQKIALLCILLSTEPIFLRGHRARCAVASQPAEGLAADLLDREIDINRQLGLDASRIYNVPILLCRWIHRYPSHSIQGIRYERLKKKQEPR
ncbi:hypothetical protein H924_06045 [Corynebacterium callunae DSM 20147]|uniref:Uncharacterized protein n=1 Tax=Corynebacterium callunae DSM 20147 TaxID=1121353 RepID=M1UYM1_9CORY|nr:hypothetical protein H924_06045 [Corynebacterium callunae DSM 20147]